MLNIKYYAEEVRFFKLLIAGILYDFERKIMD